MLLSMRKALRSAVLIFDMASPMVTFLFSFFFWVHLRLRFTILSSGNVTIIVIFVGMSLWYVYGTNGFNIELALSKRWQHSSECYSIKRKTSMAIEADKEIGWLVLRWCLRFLRTRKLEYFIIWRGHEGHVFMTCIGSYKPYFETLLRVIFFVIWFL